MQTYSKEKNSFSFLKLKALFALTIVAFSSKGEASDDFLLSTTTQSSLDKNIVKQENMAQTTNKFLQETKRNLQKIDILGKEKSILGKEIAESLKEFKGKNKEFFQGRYEKLNKISGALSWGICATTALIIIPTLQRLIFPKKIDARLGLTLPLITTLIYAIKSSSIHSKVRDKCHSFILTKEESQVYPALQLYYDIQSIHEKIFSL